MKWYWIVRIRSTFRKYPEFEKSSDFPGGYNGYKLHAGFGVLGSKVRRFRVWVSGFRPLGFLIYRA